VIKRRGLESLARWDLGDLTPARLEELRTRGALADEQA